MTRVWVWLIALAWLPLGAIAVSAESRLISFETVLQHCNAPCAMPEDYESKAALTREAARRILPKLLEAAGVAPEKAETALTFGGYLLRTNPSLLMEVEAGAEEAARLAAMTGYVFRQESVLVWRLKGDEACTGAVRISFPDVTLTSALAQRFFETAASRHAGLGGGYTAFGNEMIFLNLSGEEGAYSGLDDAAFAAALDGAAKSFTPAAKAERQDCAEAALISNDWQEEREGHAYLRLIADEGLAGELAELQTEHAASAAAGD